MELLITITGWFSGIGVLAFAYTLIYAFGNVSNKSKQYVQINTEDIRIEYAPPTKEEDDISSTDDEIVYLIYYYGKNINYYNYDSKIEEIYLKNENPPIHIGTIYIDSKKWLFEDNTCAQRTIGSRKARKVSTQNDYALIYENSNNMILPFVPSNILWIYEVCHEINENNWELEKINLKNVIPEYIKKEVIFYYEWNNSISFKNQVKINYDSRKHLKFALMDNMIRSASVGVNLDTFDGINCLNTKYNSIIHLISRTGFVGSGNSAPESEYTYAIKELIENGLIVNTYDDESYQIEKENIPFHSHDYRITPIGENSTIYGLSRAIEFNNRQAEESWIELRRNLTLWFSFLMPILGIGVAIWLHFDSIQ